MKIGFNALNVSPDYRGGVNTYVFGLLNGMIQACSVRPNDRLVIFAKNSNQHLFKNYESERCEIIVISFKNFTFKRTIRRIGLYIIPTSWYQKLNDYLFSDIGETINRNADIVYIPTTIMDYYSYKIPSVLSMHDIQHAHYPEFFTKKELRLRDVLYGLSAKKANYFQASSEFIKLDLLSHFENLKASQVEVIREGVDIKTFREQDTIDSFSDLNIPDKFLFMPAQLWKHKNHLTVLKAIQYLNQKGINIPLVLTGSSYSGSSEIFDFIEKNKLTSIYYLGVVKFEIIKMLFKRCRFLITAVLYESSSLPILEAAASGTAIMASNTAPNCELSEHLNILLFPTKDYLKLAELIEANWEVSQNESINHNLSKIEYYSWNKVAETYLLWFAKICQKN